MHPQNIMHARREALRQYVADRGGPTSIAKALGYTNGSFLSQLIGPNPSRPFTEKVARAMEGKLGLAPGYLDRNVHPLDASPRLVEEPRHTTYDKAIACVHAVATAADRARVRVSPDQLATMVALAGKHLLPDGKVDEQYVEQLLRLATRT